MIGEGRDREEDRGWFAATRDRGCMSQFEVAGFITKVQVVD
jgi:hypothetical protein